MREGLKWSDGQPFTTKDIVFWWEMAVGGNDKEKTFPSGLKAPKTPPDEARSGKGTLMTLNTPDDHTFEMVFDAPAPLTADRLAMWVNMFIGPEWVMPKHYMEQFHPLVNTQYKDFEEFNKKFNHNNPDVYKRQIVLRHGFTMEHLVLRSIVPRPFGARHDRP